MNDDIVREMAPWWSRWFVRRRFRRAEFCSFLGALNHYVMRFTPWRVAWVEGQWSDGTPREYHGVRVMRACPEDGTK